MKKLTFFDFEQIMSFDVSMKNEPCIEIEFCVDNSAEYHSSCMGKMTDNQTGNDVFWYGLVVDGSQAYEFYSFEDFANAKIFRGSSLKEIWNSVSFISIDAFDVEDRLPFYLNDDTGGGSQ